jgi:hypothetical protein
MVFEPFVLKFLGVNDALYDFLKTEKLFTTQYTCTLERVICKLRRKKNLII